MVQDRNELKRKVFYDILNIVGRAFVLVRYSDDVVIGKRGFLPAEKEKGLVLVLNSRMNFEWDDSGISATLVFGNTPEKCFIPADAVVSVFSPELSAQFSIIPGEKEAPGEKAEKKPEKVKSEGKGKATGDKKVVKVDFSKKKV